MSIVRRRKRSQSIEEIDLNSISNSTTISVSSSEHENETINRSPLIKIIEQKRRKDWAKLVAPVNENEIKKNTESFGTKLGKLFSKIPSPVRFILNYIEHRNGYTIRSYFQFIVWLFYLNLFTFILSFACIILPTYIYSNSIDCFHNQSITYYCTANDPQCQLLNNNTNSNQSICLSDSLTASTCCSSLTNEFFTNSTKESENNWREFLVDLTIGEGYLSLTRLFIGYYQNLTKIDCNNQSSQTYNMGLAVFLTIAACFLLSGIIILRKYGDGMKRSYVQNESFENDFFQYIFARWNNRIQKGKLARRIQHRFQVEIQNIFLERNDKENFQLKNIKERLLFRLQRISIWILTLFIFVAAIVALYFTNQFTFQNRRKYSNDFLNLLVEYLPSIVISMINLLSEIVFAYIRDLKLYTRTSALRHYLIRVIFMRLILLLTLIFIVILKITCNSNQCARQSELIDCSGIKDEETIIYCWETLIGQVLYRLVLTDTAVMIIVHFIVDPLRTLFIRCRTKQRVNDENQSTIITNSSSSTCFLFLPLEFEVADYVLDLTYTQTLCWHGLLFCPFLPLIAAGKNFLIFAVKLFSLSFVRRRSGLELSPARTKYIFTAVLLFSFVWALLPVAFLTTSLRPSRGCSPFRFYSSEPDYYIYYPIRNLFLQIQDQIFVQFLLKITSAVVVIPLILILILSSCVLTIRRNSYRSASIELYKLLYTSHQTHQLAVQNTGRVTTVL